MVKLVHRFDTAALISQSEAQPLEELSAKDRASHNTEIGELDMEDLDMLQGHEFCSNQFTNDETTTWQIEIAPQRSPPRAAPYP